MFKKLLGLFTNKLKYTPDNIYKSTGYIIKNNIYKVDNMSNYFILEFENDEHTFEELLIEFLLIKTLFPLDILTLLIYIRKNNKIQNKIKEILNLLLIDKYIFIDDYNFLKEDLEIVYLDKEITPTDKKILIYNPNFVFQTNLIYDLLNRLILFKNKLQLSNDILNNNLISYIKYYIPNINNSYIFDFSDNHIIDTFYITNLLNKYKIENNIIVFSDNEDIYKNIFPDNTLFLNFNTLEEKISSIKNKNLIKLMCFYLAKNVFTNNQQDFILSLLLNIIQQKLNISNNILYLYNNNTNSNLINYIKFISKHYEYEFINDIFSKPLSIAFFTRVTRSNNLNKIYQNIKNICELNFINYKWFLFIPYNKMFNYHISNDIKNDNNVVILDTFMSFNKNDNYDVNLMNIRIIT